jgi:hypothetical protein
MVTVEEPLPFRIGLVLSAHVMPPLAEHVMVTESLNPLNGVTVNTGLVAPLVFWPSMTVALLDDKPT